MTLVGVRSRATRTLACRAAGLTGVGSASLPLGGPSVAFAADETAYGFHERTRNSRGAGLRAGRRRSAPCWLVLLAPERRVR
jgi:hypothetical protein